MNEIRKVQEILKSTREEHHFSLRSIHQETKISIRYLEAIEHGDWKVFPAEVYLVGSLRKYAVYLGLKPEEIVAQYKLEQGESRVNKVEQITREVLMPERKRFRFIVQIMVLLWVGIALGGWWFYSGYEKTRPIILKTAVSPTPLKDNQMTLTLQATAMVWVRSTADQALLFEGFLSSGTVKSWPADRELVVRIGNVKAVKLSLNGYPLDSEKGSVKAVNEIQINRQNLHDFIPVKP